MLFPASKYPARFSTPTSATLKAPLKGASWGRRNMLLYASPLATDCGCNSLNNSLFRRILYSRERASRIASVTGLSLCKNELLIRSFCLFTSFHGSSIRAYTKPRQCGRGGIGRRAALRSLWGNSRGSSSLLDRTITSLTWQSPLGPEWLAWLCFLRHTANMAHPGGEIWRNFFVLHNKCLHPNRSLITGQVQTVFSDYFRKWCGRWDSNPHGHTPFRF